MKSLIVYSSQTGNTLKMAMAVYAALPGEKEMVAVDDAPEPEGYDCIAVGFWLQAGKPDPKAAAYLIRGIISATYPQQPFVFLPV